MKITVSTVVAAPIAEVWRAYNSPDDIKIWNTASPDWHTTSSKVDLRVGGKFSSRISHPRFAGRLSCRRIEAA